MWTSNFRAYLFTAVWACLFSVACQQTSPTPPATAPPATAPPTRTASARPTAVPSYTATPAPPATATHTHTHTPTSTATSSQTPTPTPTPTATPDTALYGLIDTLDPAGTPVIFWHSYDGYAGRILDEIVAGFNETNPDGITVQALYKGNFGNLHQAVSTGLANGGALPHLTAAFADKTLEYGAAVVDVRPYLYHPVYGFSQAELADFFPGVLLLETAVSGLPLHRVMELLYINEDWLASLPLAGPPQTPAQFIQAACAAADPAQGAAQGAVGYEIEATSGNFLAWIQAFGGNVYDEAAGAFTFATPEAVAAMTMLQQLLQDGCATAARGFDYQDNFARQRTLFGPGTSRGLYFYDRAVDSYNAAPFFWSVAPLPTTAETPATLITGPDFNLLRTDPPAQLAAWLFLRYFFSPEVQARWAQVNDHLPARAAAAAYLSATFAENPAYAAAFQLMPYAQQPPASTGQYAVWQAMVAAYGRILAGEEATAVLRELDEIANQQ